MKSDQSSSLALSQWDFAMGTLGQVRSVILKDARSSSVDRRRFSVCLNRNQEMIPPPGSVAHFNGIISRYQREQNDRVRQQPA